MQSVKYFLLSYWCLHPGKRRHLTQDAELNAVSLCNRQDDFLNISVYPGLSVPRGDMMDARTKQSRG